MKHRKLYYSSLSPYARKIRIILSELNLDYQSDRYDRMRPVEQISSLNPNLTIPVLEDKDLSLFDSRVISEYLLETYGESYQNTGKEIPFFTSIYRPDHKWKDLKILATIETLTETIVSIFLYSNSIERTGGNPGEVEYLKRQRIRVENILDWLNTLATNDGFYPEFFTLADLKLISALGMCDAKQLIDWKGRSAIDALTESFRDRKSVSSTVP